MQPITFHLSDRFEGLHLTTHDGGTQLLNDFNVNIEVIAKVPLIFVTVNNVRRSRVWKREMTLSDLLMAARRPESFRIYRDAGFKAKEIPNEATRFGSYGDLGTVMFGATLASDPPYPVVLLKPADRITIMQTP